MRTVEGIFDLTNMAMENSKNCEACGNVGIHYPFKISDEAKNEIETFLPKFENITLGNGVVEKKLIDAIEGLLKRYESSIFNQKLSFFLCLAHLCVFVSTYNIDPRQKTKYYLPWFQVCQINL